MQNKHFITGHTLSSVKEIRGLCYVGYYRVRFFSPCDKHLTFGSTHLQYIFILS